MSHLIYTAITSLDGYVADATGNFDWSVPDEEVHAFVNDLERPIGTYLYGRRLYEVMVAWESEQISTAQLAFVPDFAAIWRAAEKVVYSSTLENVGSTRTRIERTFDPTVVRVLKESTDRDISVGGAELAGQALAAGLVDECHLIISPVLVGGGKHAFPDGVRQRLELLDQHRFGNGVVHLHYGITS